MYWEFYWLKKPNLNSYSLNTPQGMSVPLTSEVSLGRVNSLVSKLPFLGSHDQPLLIQGVWVLAHSSPKKNNPCNGFVPEDTLLPLPLIARFGTTLSKPKIPWLVPSNHKPEHADWPKWALAMLEWPTHSVPTARAYHTPWYLLLKYSLTCIFGIDYDLYHWHVTQPEVLQ